MKYHKCLSNRGLHLPRMPTCRTLSSENGGPPVYKAGTTVRKACVDILETLCFQELSVAEIATRKKSEMEVKGTEKRTLESRLYVRDQ